MLIQEESHVKDCKGLIALLRDGYCRGGVIANGFVVVVTVVKGRSVLRQYARESHESSVRLFLWPPSCPSSLLLRLRSWEVQVASRLETGLLVAGYKGIGDGVWRSSSSWNIAVVAENHRLKGWDITASHRRIHNPGLSGADGLFLLGEKGINCRLDWPCELRIPFLPS
jgi:hypothetical protein